MIIWERIRSKTVKTKSYKEIQEISRICPEKCWGDFWGAIQQADDIKQNKLQDDRCRRVAGQR